MEPTNELLAICSDITERKNLFGKKLYCGGQPMTKCERNYAPEAANAVRDFLQKKALPPATVVPHTYGPVLLNAWLSADGTLAAVRMYTFVPYEYQPATDWTLFRGDDCRKLATFLRRK